MLLVCWQSRSLHFPLGHSVGAFSGACTAVMLVVVEVVMVDVGVVLVLGMAFVVVVVVVVGVGVVVGLVSVELIVLWLWWWLVVLLRFAARSLVLLGRWTCLVRSTSVRILL